jgi:hypothetical protein
LFSISNIQQKIAAFCLIPLAIVGLSICIRPLQAILFHSDHVYFGERIHFHRAFRENSKKAGCLLEAGTIHLVGVGKVLFLLLPVQVVTEAHFKHAGMGLLRVVTACFGCTSFQEGV